MDTPTPCSLQTSLVWPRGVLGVGGSWGWGTGVSGHGEGISGEYREQRVPGVPGLGRGQGGILSLRGAFGVQGVLAVNGRAGIDDMGGYLRAWRNVVQGTGGPRGSVWG